MNSKLQQKLFIEQRLDRKFCPPHKCPTALPISPKFTISATLLTLPRLQGREVIYGHKHLIPMNDPQSI